MAAPVDRGIGLCDEIIFFAVAGQVFDVVGDAPIMHLAVGSFDKAKLVDAGEGRHRANETDVWSFRRLDRANAAVVGRMHVAHFESSAITAQSARAERGQTTFVR